MKQKKLIPKKELDSKPDFSKAVLRLREEHLKDLDSQIETLQKLREQKLKELKKIERRSHE